MPIDPLTFSVLKNAFDAIVDEMAYTVLRTARSEIVKDVMDFSAALCDREGRMVAQAKTIALHLGAVPEAMAAVQARFGNSLAAGDAIIVNDPYHGGMHLPDIFMFVPIFQDEMRSAWAVVICHHTDVGGRVPGSNASDSTEIYQEGLRIAPVKLYERGEPNPVVHDFIRLNVRVPDRVLGDLAAQYAACQVGAREHRKLATKCGASELALYSSELLDYAELLAREEIRSWPDGTYRFTDYIDDDGFDDTPLPISVAITVAGDRLIVDYAGSAPQVKAALNSTKSYTNSCTYLSVRCALTADVPNNAGLFRCIEVRAPEASILNPLPPAACAARALTGYRVMDAMFGALSQIVPARIPAAAEGGNTVVCLSGRRPDNSPFIIVDMVCGAWGGRSGKDGIEAITNPSQNLSNTPTEVLEAQHPVLIEDYALVPDSGGAGEWRGGLGIRRSYRVLSEDALLQLRSDRMRFRPYGLFGGEPGRATRNAFRRGGVEEALPSKVTRGLRQGDVVIHEQAGGGGFGDPLARDPRRVARDVWNEKLSTEFAREHYGVVVDARGTLDLDASAALRAARRAIGRSGG
ncbi:MAG TPA: hydantoinase B/oxoprolinase family protein [Stellaceae bacterium]|nr:hydantoinase B/oxoprolinase family protein [Stellaceae bacterium]